MTQPTDDIKLPPFPEPTDQVGEYEDELWDAYDVGQMIDYARAAVLADRQSRTNHSENDLELVADAALNRLFTVSGIEAAAIELSNRMDYPWSYMPEKGRDEMRRSAKAVIDAARAAGGEA